MKSATIIRSGPLCTIQDLGRTSGLRKGISPGGAMDRRALLWANRLLDNPPSAPALEITLGNAAILFEHQTTIAITGAACDIWVDGHPANTWRTLTVGAGATVEVGFARNGLRSYVAFPGGLIAERFHGSASVVLREGLEGELGHVLAPNDRLQWPGAPSSAKRAVPPEFRSLPGHVLSVPIITGYEWADFSAEDRRRVFDTEWTIQPQSDRIATRLTGIALTSGPRVLDSAPLVDGTIQILPDGQPLVFMRDRPTIGGYPKVGAVVPTSLDDLSQARPGSLVRFVKANVSEARSAMLRQRDFFGIS
jgi:5-oxoprolinase (ATP-hydrolysing) subunit C